MVRRSLSRVGPALALIVVVGAFALLTDEPSRYLSLLNLRIVVSQTVIVALGAIGMTMIIVSGGIDLSVGSVIALTGVVTALGLVAGWPLGDPRRHSDAVMENLIGCEITGWHDRLAETGSSLHLYGKREARAGRKMGHVTRLFPRPGGAA